jgi:OOP family OmpA-OmpF porin
MPVQAFISAAAEQKHQQTDRFLKTVIVPWIAFILAILAFSGCTAWKQTAVLPHKSADAEIDSSMYRAKVERFYVILDASSSMDRVCGSYRKYDLAVNILDRMNQMLPEYNMQSGLRSFGHHPEFSKKDTLMVYELQPYSTAEFGRTLHEMKPVGGTSPLQDAFKAAEKDLSGLPGRTALILLSDGKDMDPSVLPAARQLAGTYGEGLCIHTVFLGDDHEGKDLLQAVADITDCGFLTTGSDLIDNRNLTRFVHAVFLDNPAVTETGVTDSDRDGVIDKWDECPKTPAGADVGVNGCWRVESVFFEFDKARIRPRAAFELDQVAEILEMNPRLRVKFQGHTCDIGTREYNLKLSHRRADAVRQYMIDKGISPKRLESEGMGFSKPLVPNISEKNRTMNRRTEIHPLDHPVDTAE